VFAYKNIKNLATLCRIIIGPNFCVNRISHCEETEKDTHIHADTQTDLLFIDR